MTQPRAFRRTPSRLWTITKSPLVRTSFGRSGGVPLEHQKPTGFEPKRNFGAKPKQSERPLDNQGPVLELSLSTGGGVADTGGGDECS
jgi:hypothetical protein